MGIAHPRCFGEGELKDVVIGTQRKNIPVVFLFNQYKREDEMVNEKSMTMKEVDLIYESQERRYYEEDRASEERSFEILLTEES